MKFLSVFLAAALIAGSAGASDITQKTGHKTYLKTNRAAQCSTTSGKLSRSCTQTPNTQTSKRAHY